MAREAAAMARRLALVAENGAPGPNRRSSAPFFLRAMTGADAAPRGIRNRLTPALVFACGMTEDAARVIEVPSEAVRHLRCRESGLRVQARPGTGIFAKPVREQR